MLSPEQLRRAREAAGLTQLELALLVGVADGTRVAAWEGGRSAPRAVTLHRLAQVLGQESLTEEEALTLREHRLRAGLSVTKLAAEVGVSRSTVIRWESARTVPRATQLKRVAEVLNVSPTHIM